MTFYSPLRYPGGKRKLANFLALVCQKNEINGHYVEPYAGGASVALFLLINAHVSKITINDADKSIYAFWYAVLNHSDKFCKLIKNTEVNIKHWRKYKLIQENKEKAPLFDLGFSTFFLNRTNRSGIINGGPMGGFKQKGKYKIDCRFKKEDLIKRIRLIAKHKKNIYLNNLDALELVRRIKGFSNSSNIIFYFDPPYFLKGESLYLNHYKKDDHKKVSEEIAKIKNCKWIVSYDSAPEIKKLYKNFNKIEYSLYHSAYSARIGKEVIFSSKNLVMPKILNPTEAKL